MIQLHELLSEEALRRYDDNGDPLFKTTERVLLTMRWFDWVTMRELLSALDIYDARGQAANTIRKAMGRLIRARRVVWLDGKYRLA